MDVLAALPLDLKKKVVAYLPVGPPKAFLASIKAHVPKSYTICDGCKGPTTVPGFSCMTWTCCGECHKSYCEFCFEYHFPTELWKCHTCMKECTEDWFPWYAEQLHDIGI
jgi:hypothetical protein